MAQRRMMSLKVIDTDDFLDMPMSARLLYYDLNMRADDDGFVSSPKKIQRMIGASEDDYKVLLTKQFIIPFDSGICVIRHWRVHNYIQKDRYSPTIYEEQKKHLETDKNGIYKKMDTECIQNGYISDTQVRLGKVRLEKEKEKEKKVNKKKTFDDLINNYTSNNQLQETLTEYIKMRINKRAKPTNRALELVFMDLDKLSDNDSEKIQILENSIKNNWTGVFELKNKRGGKSGKVTGTSTENDSNYWNGYDLAKNRYKGQNWSEERFEQEMQGLI